MPHVCPSPCALAGNPSFIVLGRKTAASDGSLLFFVCFILFLLYLGGSVGSSLLHKLFL